METRLEYKTPYNFHKNAPLLTKLGYIFILDALNCL